jgi:outer membrane receptor protein involved in Fe transport
VRIALPSCLTAAFAVGLVFLPAIVSAASSQPQSQDLKTMSIEQLMQIDVTLATREPVPIGRTAAAITVITNDDIRRSGVTTIADAVALADGVHVARFNNGTWAVSARGFNSTSANKLLVMIDGRTEYSPLFTGVFWNMLDYTLEDIDRIEVIRGPGATLWGANAVNGVINIITRHTRDTQGTLVGVGTGNEDPALADFRYGASTASSRAAARRSSTPAIRPRTADAAARSDSGLIGPAAAASGCSRATSSTAATTSPIASAGSFETSVCRADGRVNSARDPT